VPKRDGEKKGRHSSSRSGRQTATMPLRTTPSHGTNLSRRRTVGRKDTKKNNQEGTQNNKSACSVRLAQKKKAGTKAAAKKSMAKGKNKKEESKQTPYVSRKKASPLDRKYLGVRQKTNKQKKKKERKAHRGVTCRWKRRIVAMKKRQPEIGKTHEK